MDSQPGELPVQAGQQGRVADQAERAPAAKNSLGKQLIGVVLAIGFLWLAFGRVNMQELFSYMTRLDPLFLFYMFLCGVVSHLVRAARWLIFLAPIAQRRLSLWNSFCAVIYGYAVNVVIPRGGEVARLVSIARSEELPWAGVLPTMFIDRLLDIACLVGLLGLSLVFLPENVRREAGLLVPAGAAMCVCVVVGLALLPFAGSLLRRLLALPALASKLKAEHQEALQNLARQFDLGTKSLTNLAVLPGVIALSVLIWFFYWLNFYLIVLAFHLQDKVSLEQSLAVFTLGSVGVLVPTPGSVGSYHFLISQGLVKLCGMNATQALAFATVLHFFCFVVITCLPAAFCFVVQMAIKKRGA